MIASIAPRAPERGAVDINAKGLAVAPGFVDIHSHGDGSLWEDPRAESLIRQGITTIVVGQDGSSRVPRVSRDPLRQEYDAFRELWSALDVLAPAVNVRSVIA